MADYLHKLLELVEEHNIIPDVPVGEAMILTLNPDRFPAYLSGVVLG